MTTIGPQRARARRTRPGTLVVLVAVSVAVLALVLPRALGSSTTVSRLEVLLGEQRDGRGEAEGAVPDGTTVFDDHLPAVARLDPALVDALRRAAADAAQVGIVLEVTSGWRSPEYQRRLQEEAISEHGSAEEAARWVAAPEASLHVSGDAVDLGPAEALAWLSEHGAAYGLCQVYDNEPWHYELRPGAVTGGCPPRYADPTQDPRL